MANPPFLTSARHQIGSPTPSDIAVWAPGATTIELVIDDDATATRHPMHPADGGWWTADPATADIDVPVDDARYGFSIDGGPVRPDPRSARQPDGVHGLSAFFRPDPAAQAATRWSGRSVHGAVIYELHVGTFTPAGTLDAAIGHLDDLVDLGVDFVELMPLNAVNGIHNWGYDGVGWYAVHEPYGGPDALLRFVGAAHERGLGVVLDVVYNHLGPSGNYLPEFGPYLSEGTTSWGSSVNLSGPDSDEVRAFIVDSALRWFDVFGIDALRLDAVHAFVDHRAVHLLEELATATDALSARLGRPLGLIAESDLNDPRLVLPRSRGGYGLAAQWDDDIHHAIHTAVSGERHGYYADFGSYSTLSKVLRGGFFHDGTYSSFRRRRHGRPIPTDLLPATAFLAYTCTHDQVGNRAAGDRPSAYLDGGQLAIKAALVVLSPFTPMLFMGEEWGAGTPFQYFTSHPEPELGEAVRTGRQAEFADHGWASTEVPDPQDPATFAASKLDWSERDSPDHRRILDFYRALIALRREQTDLHAPGFDSIGTGYDEQAGWFAMHRGQWSVICVLAPNETVVPIGVDVELSWAPVETTSGTVTSPGHNVVVGRRTSPIP